MFVERQNVRAYSPLTLDIRALCNDFCTAPFNVGLVFVFFYYIFSSEVHITNNEWQEGGV